MHTNIDPNLIIDEAGGPSAVAKLCGITPSSVTQWRTNGIPKSWLAFLRLALPEVFAAVERRAFEESQGAAYE